MATNDTGYELHVGPDKDGRYLTVQPGEEYEPPEPAEQLGEPETAPADEDDPAPTVTVTATATGAAGQRTADRPGPTGKPADDPTTTPPASTGTHPANQTAQPNGDDQKAETTP